MKAIEKVFKSFVVLSVVFTSLLYSRTICWEKTIPPFKYEYCDQDFDSCRQALTYAMDKQKKDLKERLEDLKATIEENTEQTIHQTKIIEQEVLAYQRLLARIKQENESLSEAKYLSKKINHTEMLGVKIDMLDKGKQ